MKLATLTTILRNKVVRGAGIVALAGAALTLTPAAQAQRLVFGVHVGPRYVAPAPVYVAPRPYFAPPVVVYGGPAYGYGYFDRFHAWHRDRDDRWRHDRDDRWRR